MKIYQGAGPPSVEEVVNEIRPIPEQALRPALLARISVIPMRPSPRSILRGDHGDAPGRALAKRLFTSHRIETEVRPQLLEEITRRCTEAETGARNVEHILRGSLIPAVSPRAPRAHVAGDRCPVSSTWACPRRATWRIEFDESAARRYAVADEPDTAEEAEQEPEQFAEA
ncbi:MAG: hypothetical protein IPF99_02815 [Deltaproteobacteria bacterium]|nr:hypothetical protein [Deltaproteobacteria bacterium]